MAFFSANTVVSTGATSTPLVQYQIYHQVLYTGAGQQYYHFKSNIPVNNVNNIMFMFEAVGYSYATGNPIRCSWCGYSYSATSNIINIGLHNAYNGLSANGVYKSSDGYVCLRGVGYDYYVGFSLNSYSTNPAGFGNQVQITTASFNANSGSYY